MSSPAADLRTAVAAAMADVAGGELPDKARRFSLERPKQADHGDLATNAAMLLTKVVGQPPRDVAAQLADRLGAALGDRLAGTDIAGPGFLNLRLSDGWYAGALAGLLAADGFGGGTAAPAEKVQVEFVSANPTGPIHLGHARNAAYGDAVARILAFHGHDVEREYYVNDAGTQVQVFAASVQARARGEEVPEGGYPGAYVQEIADAVPGAADLPPDELAPLAVAAMMERIRATLERFRVHHDVFFSEASLHEGDRSEVHKALELLAASSKTYAKDGALFLKTEELGDDKDRVAIRSTGEHTYFASDIAYSLSKQERGFDRFVYVLGADHHGYVARLKAAFQQLGGDPDRLDVLIMQFVHLSGGASFSKRAGVIQTLDDLIEAVGVDASRWFLLNRSHDTTIEFDLELATTQSNENPVYYVQYAHARIASILRRAEGAPGAEPAEALHPSERALVLKLVELPDEVRIAAERRAPHRVATYALELAQAFTAFYRDCPVLGGPSEAFRLGLCVATQRTLATSLDLLGVSAPDEM